MDSAIKAIVNVFLTFVSVILLLSCITFFIAYNHATTILYSVVQDVEIYGNDSKRVNDYALKNNLTISVSPIESAYGYRYLVTVGFNHVFAFVNMDKQFIISSSTRMFEY